MKFVSSNAMAKILMVASEATPFAKTGGLADVVGALSPTLRAHGHDVAIIMPRYRGVSLHGLPCVYQDLRVWFGPSSYTGNLYRAVERDVAYFLLDCPALYDRDGLYGASDSDYPDNYLRFAVFARAALRVVRYVFRPQILHCHDWQAALVPIFIRTRYAADPTFIGPRTVLTIHNLGYQGIFPKEVLPQIGLDPALVFKPELLEYYGQVNFLKGAILYSDAVTTVSKTYAHEIQTPELGFGLDGVLRARSGALTGILNGVDYTQWDPATDPFLAAHYGPDNLEGKSFCKADLLREFGLPEANLSRPMIGMVTRLAKQKGLDLLQEVASDLMAEDLCLVALGSGDPGYEQFLRELAAAHPQRCGVRIGYDDALAHKIEAGADMFLMPSLYEPCGLNQIYSLKYGTVPVVRATGGLDDTIDEGTGFKFWEYSGRSMLAAIRSALAAYQDRAKWIAMMRAGMRKDYSWNASAVEYTALYNRLTA